jgi:hypothetical protein
MNVYYQDVFYDVNKLSFKNKIQLLKDAKDLCFNWWVDILDCSKSLCREKINLSFEEVIDICNKKTKFIFIHRRGYDDLKKSNWYFEVGYTNMSSPDYFLWIQVNENYVDNLIKKYNLSKIEL